MADETAGRLHSHWLSMMYPRLLLGRNLLSEDGVMAVSIGDEEHHNLRHLLAEAVRRRELCRHLRLGKEKEALVS